MRIIPTPNEFRPAPPVTYPMHQRGDRLEDYLYKYFSGLEKIVDTDWVFLPISWDNYQVKAKFGKDTAMMNKLEDYINSTMKQYPDKKFWSVCEYVDGIGVDIYDPSRLHMFYCARSGGTSLPLLCDPHEGIERPRDYVACFVGSEKTHPIRQSIVDTFGSDDRYFVRRSCDTATFVDAMARSHFALCPRGYGPTSYRLFEAMQFGTVPVYISDEFILPMQDELEWSSFCFREPINISMDTLKYSLETFLRSEAGILKLASDQCKEVSKSHFNMQATAEYIVRWLEKNGKNS